MKKEYRIEVDSIGEYKVRSTALYGSQTQRSFDTFKITKMTIDKDFILALIMFKKAAAKTNYEIGNLDKKIANAIIESCDDILNSLGKYKKEFITDRIQGGAGTSINMNVNEVLANMATLKLGGKLGEYIVNPNDHVNRGQSTNDVIPTSSKIALINKIHKFLKVVKKLEKSLLKKAKEFEDVIKLGRTHIQDAVPMTVGSFFEAWAKALKRDYSRVEGSIRYLKLINVGSTAIGTGISQKPEYPKKVVHELEKMTNFELENSFNLIDATRNTDAFAYLATNLKIMALNLSKNCNDLRLLSSGPLGGIGEFILPAIQPGSSIMPGKINPVIPEVVNQICFSIIGKELTISLASEAGQLELNVFEPIIFHALFDSLDYLKRGLTLLNTKTIKDLKINRMKINKNLNRSTAFATVFANKYGYALISKIIKNAIKDNKYIKDALIEGLNIDEKTYEEIISKKNIMPLISGK